MAALDHAMPNVVNIEEAIQARDNGEVTITLVYIVA